MAPVDSAAAAFDPGRLLGSESSSGGSGGGSGSGGLAGQYDGASVPVFGQLSGLDDAALDANGDQPVADTAASTGSTLPVPALAAVIALAAVTAALVRTQQATRAQR
jgi:hypothetical protein